MLDKPLIPFNIVGIAAKVTTEYFNVPNVQHFSRPCCNSFLNKTDPSDPLQILQNFQLSVFYATKINSS